MQVEQRRWTKGAGWAVTTSGWNGANAQLVLFFGERALLADGTMSAEVAAQYPGALIMGCSTAGEICGSTVADGTAVATAIHFERTRCALSVRQLLRAEDSATVGAEIGAELHANDLAHVFVLGSGVNINGSALVEGLRGSLPQVPITGGLAGDGTKFERTVVCCNDRVFEGGVVAVGFYGHDLLVGYGSMGGWDPFGPERLVTRSLQNVLYELDGQRALDLYRTYLGPHAAELPASGLLFPLSIRSEQGDAGVVRTTLGIDEPAGSLVFAGDVPQGGYVRLMRANLDRLIDGAHLAAGRSTEHLEAQSPTLAILVSCVGRKLVVRQRIEEEVETVRAVVGQDAVLSGFYSYGEIAPFAPFAKCELHNQTMTVTTLCER